MEVFVFFIGSIFGSCINVIALRSVRNEDFLMGRSRCPNCQHQLSFLDMIPIISYLFLKGRCKYCDHKISIRYPIVELISGGLAVLCLQQFDLFHLFLFYQLLFISLVDIEIMEIKEIYQWMILLTEILILGVDLIQWDHLMGMICISIPLLVISLLNRSIGGADIQLYALLGLFVGVKKTVVGFVLSILFGLVVGLFMLIMNKKSRKDGIPFIPMIAMGYLISLLYGEKIADLYLKILLK